VLVRFRRLVVFVGEVLDRDLALELSRDELDLFVGQRLGRRAHLAETHEDLDDLAHRDAERLREVPYGDAGLDGRRARRLDDLPRLLRAAAVRALALLTCIARRTRRGAVDDHAPLAPPGGTLTGPHRAVWPV